MWRGHDIVCRTQDVPTNLLSMGRNTSSFIDHCKKFRKAFWIILSLKCSWKMLLTRHLNKKKFPSEENSFWEISAQRILLSVCGALYSTVCEYFQLWPRSRQPYMCTHRDAQKLTVIAYELLSIYIHPHVHIHTFLKRTDNTTGEPAPIKWETWEVRILHFSKSHHLSFCICLSVCFFSLC